MLKHAGLRKSEGGEDANRVERQQLIERSAEINDKSTRQKRQDDNTVVKNEPVADSRERPREKSIAGKEARQPREVRKGRICGKDQDAGSRKLDVIEAEA